MGFSSNTRKSNTDKASNDKASNDKRRLLSNSRLKIGLLMIALLLTSAWLIYRDPTEPRNISSDTFSKLSLEQSVQAIADATVEGGAPGVVVLIRKNGVDTVATAGVRNKATKQVFPANAPLRIASISKVYSATVILALERQGLVNLNAKISEYLGDEIISGVANAKDATVRQLLLHTAGIPDYYDLRSYFLQDWTKPITLQRTLPVSRRGDATFAAGEKFEYSNMGYIFLGEIAERVSGKSLKSLIDEIIIQPLELDNTYYNVKHPVENGIHGYGTIFQPWADTYNLWEHSGPDAGVMASAAETAQFLEALTFDSGALADLGETMLSETVESGPRRKQALGLEIIIGKQGAQLIGHTGDTFGYQTVSLAVPSSNIVFVASINCDCTALISPLIANLFRAAHSHKEEER